MSQPNGAGAAAAQQQSNVNPFMSAYTNWSDSNTWITRHTMVGIVVIYLLSFLFPSLDLVLGNTPYFTLFSFELYRLILSPLVGNSILTVILIALFYPNMGTRMETSIGSSAFIHLLGMITLFTNTIFATLCLFMYFMGTIEALFWSCSGFWTVLFGLITIECLQIPDAPRRMMFIPVDIPSKYFPLILYAFFALFNGFQLDFLVSMGVGYMYTKGHLDRFKLSPAYLDTLESANGMLHSISRGRGWVLAGAAIGHAAWTQGLPVATAVPVNEGSGSGSSPRGGAQQQGPAGSSSSSSGFSSWGPGGNGGGSGNGDGKKEAFPGSGRTLSGSTGTTAAGSGGGGFGGLGQAFGGTFASAPVATSLSSSSSASGGISRELVNARRLQALGGGVAATAPPQQHQQQQQQQQQPAAPDMEKVKKITQMGFSKGDAIRALDSTAGNVEAALLLLAP